MFLWVRFIYFNLIDLKGDKLITLFQLDKSGNDIFERDYSVVLILNKNTVYGINIPQKIKDDVFFSFKRKALNIIAPTEKARKNRLRIRFHTAILIKLIERAIYDLGYIDEVNIELCNDIDGHFHEIKYMLFNYFNKLILNLKLEDIVLTKFEKPSLIDSAGSAFRRKNKIQLKDYIQLDLKSEEVIKIIKK